MEKFKFWGREVLQKKKFYVIRHCQINWNYEGKLQGKTDIELNENGIEQAKKVKELIKNYDIDLIVSSPLKRARKTAEIINETSRAINGYFNGINEDGTLDNTGLKNCEIREYVI